MTCTHSSSVRPTAVHSRDRFPTTGFSEGSKAYIDDGWYRSSEPGRPTYQPAGVLAWPACQAASRSVMGREASELSYFQMDWLMVRVHGQLVLTQMRVRPPYRSE